MSAADGWDGPQRDGPRRDGPERDGSDLVDWDFARATARRLVPRGPQVSTGEAREVVAQLRSFAVESEHHVRRFTGLQATGGTAPVLVVDRPSWVDVNIDGFSRLLRPLLAKLRARRGHGTGLLVEAGPRITGLEVGALLAYLGGKVLGQFEVFASPQGTLLLVAPNIVSIERELRVDPRDFRLWVCLHEETHRTQFTAVPWLRDYVLSEINGLVDETDLDPGALARRLAQGARAVIDAVRGGEGMSLLDLLQTPKQREIVERLTAVMSLLEGHADYVMDGVGPQVIPSVTEIRAKFQRRRASPGGFDATLRRLLGLDAKLRQYRDGERFVRGVVDRVGMTGFNQVWTARDTLPTKAELHDPAAWVARVHGRPALGA
jgi:coenzyme F420 biosynthesis associated uncharacterized protein